MSQRTFSDSDFVDTPKRTFDESDFAPANDTLQDKTERAAGGLVNGVIDYAKGLNRTVNPFSRENRDAAYNLVAHPVDTISNALRAQGQLYEASKQSFQNKDYMEGVRHAISYLLPVIGPQIDEAGNKVGQGKFAEGMGEATGIGLNTAAMFKPNTPPTPNPKAAGVAQDLYYQAIKPGLKTQINTTPAEVRAMVETGLGNKLPVSEAGATKLTRLAGDLNNKVDAIIAKNPNATIPATAVVSRLAPTLQKFRNQVNPTADLIAIGESGKEFLQTQPADIPAQVAQALKKGTYQQLGEKAYGELGTASVEAQKALARGIREELQTQFPEIQDLNAQEGKLYDLQDVLQRAVNKAANNRSTWLKDAATIGVGKAVTGQSSMGVGLAIMRHILSDPAVKSKLAIAINEANGGKVGGPSMTASAGKVNAFLQSLNPSQSASENGQ